MTQNVVPPQALVAAEATLTRKIESVEQELSRIRARDTAGPRMSIGSTRGPGISKAYAVKAMSKAVNALERSTSGLNGDAARVALSMALPLSYPPQRVTSLYSSTPTSVAKPYYLRDAKFDVANADANIHLLLPGSFMAAVSRNPLRSLIQYVVNTFTTPNSATGPYLGCYVGTIYFDGVSGPTPVCNPGQNEYQVQFNLPISFHADSHAGDTAYFHPHGPKVYAGQHDAKRGFYLDANSSYSARVYLSSDQPGRWSVYILRGATWVPTGSIGGSTATFVLTVCGYYAVDFKSDNDATSSAITGYVVTSASSFGHWSLPYMEAKDTVLPTIRTTACSLMWSCVASNLNAEGACAGVQLKPGQSWLDIAGPSNNPVTEVLKNTGGEGAAEFPLKKGIYGFHKPVNEHALNEIALSRSNQFGVVDLVYPLVEQDGWLVVAASTAKNGTTYPGGDGYLTAAWAVEFESTDPWYGAIVPPGQKDAFENAVEAIKYLPQWHENPLHFKDVTRFLGNIGRTGLKVAPAFFKVLRSISPEFAGVFEGLSAASAAGAALL